MFPWISSEGTLVVQAALFSSSFGRRRFPIERRVARSEGESGGGIGNVVELGSIILSSSSGTSLVASEAGTTMTSMLLVMIVCRMYVVDVCNVFVVAVVIVLLVCGGVQIKQ